MPQFEWSNKRERQYEHIKESLKSRGQFAKVAKEIAARTVNKERARHGEAKESSLTYTSDILSGRRGALNSHRGPQVRTRDQLYQEARKKNIVGRSKMNKDQLEKALKTDPEPARGGLGSLAAFLGIFFWLASVK